MDARESTAGLPAELPAELQTRPLNMDDSAAVATLIGLEEIVALGRAEVTTADIVAGWQRPGFEVASGTIGIFDSERLIGYAEYSGADRCDVAVDPAHHHRGIGRAMAGWVREQARAAGAARVGMQIPRGSAADQFLQRHGYEVRRIAWDLELPAHVRLDEDLPDGYLIRTATSDDYDRVWNLLEDAFTEWSDRPKWSLGDFLAQTVQRPGFAPDHLRVATDPRGRLVGAAYAVLDAGAGEVDRLAVHPAYRRQGLARALLADTFGVLRAQGATRCTLSTDSRTGALPLYEHLGMIITSTWVNRSIELRE